MNLPVDQHWSCWRCSQEIWTWRCLYSSVLTVKWLQRLSLSEGLGSRALYSIYLWTVHIRFVASYRKIYCRNEVEIVFLMSNGLTGQPYLKYALFWKCIFSFAPVFCLFVHMWGCWLRKFPLSVLLFRNDAARACNPLLFKGTTPTAGLSFVGYYRNMVEHQASMSGRGPVSIFVWLVTPQ